MLQSLLKILIFFALWFFGAAVLFLKYGLPWYTAVVIPGGIIGPYCAIRNTALSKRSEKNSETDAAESDNICPNDNALTYEELKENKIVEKIHCRGVILKEDDLIKDFSSHGLISRVKQKGARSTLAFNYDGFFTVNSINCNKLFIELIDRTKSFNFSGIGVISEDKSDLKRILFSIPMLDEWINSSVVETIFQNDVVMMQSKIFEDLSAGDNVIVLNFANNDRKLLIEAVRFIQKTNVNIVGVYSLFSSYPDEIEFSSTLKEEALVNLKLQ